MILAAIFASQALWVTYEGESGPGKGKHIVLLAGDEEYRSEEALPQLAKILSQRHGFKCTVLFSINEKGEIDPKTQTNQPGLEALKTADLCIMLLRFRQWPDEQMKHFVDYFESGKPFIAMRTSTHAFAYSANSTSIYKHFGWQSQSWVGGFGEQVLGENWISHWGDHGRQATRGIVVPDARLHPLMKGATDVFGTTDVYEAHPPADARVLMTGQVVEGMKPEDPAATGNKKTAEGKVQGINDPMMPLAWVRRHNQPDGTYNQVFTTTMGSATDLLSPGFRRMIVNAVFWTTKTTPPDSPNVDIVGKYEPSNFGFDGFKKGVKPSDHRGLP